MSKESINFSLSSGGDYAPNGLAFSVPRIHVENIPLPNIHCGRVDINGPPKIL